MAMEAKAKIKPGDTVYVIATCADAPHRASGTCWFYEAGGCPFQESGRLKYCGEREDVRGVFETVFDAVDETTKSMTLRGLSFGSVSDFRISLCHWGVIAFATRKQAETALQEMEAEREYQEKKTLFRAVEALRRFCAKTNCEHCAFCNPSFCVDGNYTACCMFRRVNPHDWNPEEVWK